MTRSLLFITCLLLLMLVSCNDNALDIDTSEIKTEPIRLLRLDEDLFSINAGNIDEKTVWIKKKYGQYFEHYLMGFLVRNGTADSAYKRSVLGFVSDADVRACYNTVKTLFPGKVLEGYLPELDECVKRFRYHFPAQKVPEKWVTCLTGWNYSMAYLDTHLVTGLDMYLGDTSRFYAMLRYPQYQTRKMNGAYLLPDIARGWLLTEFDKAPAENTLLQHTIFFGKLFYAVNALLPDAPDSVIIGYTASQIKYCNEFEKQLWKYFAEKNRLFENNMNTVRELTSDGPFTGAISKDCPPRIAMWVGWQIVRNYMHENPDIKLADLMKDQDAQKILNKSRYRP
jgi:hypothetical protein